MEIADEALAGENQGLPQKKVAKKRKINYKKYVPF
jgi:hypothetical protein